MSITDTGFGLHGSETAVVHVRAIFLYNHIKESKRTQASLPPYPPSFYQGAKSFSEITHLIFPHVLWHNLPYAGTKPITGHGN